MLSLLRSRYSLLLLLIPAFLVGSWQMYHLPLFERWSALVICSAWGILTVLRAKRYEQRYLYLSLLSGLLLTLGFPPSPFLPLIFVGFVPLLIIEHERPKGLFKYIFQTFFIFNIGATYWVANAGFVAGLIANFANALLMSLTFWAFSATGNRLPKIKYLIFAIFWLAFEQIHLQWEISWTWLNLGNAFAEYPSWVQWYDITGVFGGSLWVLESNIMLLKTWRWWQTRREFSKRLMATTSLTLLLPLLFSFVYVHFLPEELNPKKAKIVALQPNYEPHYQKFTVPEPIQLEQFRNLSLTAIDSTTDYLIFPETSFDLKEKNQMKGNWIATDLRQMVKPYPRLHLVMGIDAYHIFNFGENQEGHAVRQSRDGRFEFEAYNAATQIAAADTLGEKMPFYQKSKLVPGPELLPYGRFLFFLKPLFDKFGGSTAGLGLQKERSVFKNLVDTTLSVAPVICYESIYGDFCRGYIKNGANAIFVMTNDGWWGDTEGYRQHRAFASLRAIEFRRWVVRSANSGSCSFINPRGEIVSKTDYDIPTALKGEIEMLSGETIYCRIGDIIGKISLYLPVLFVFGAIVRAFRRK